MIQGVFFERLEDLNWLPISGVHDILESSQSVVNCIVIYAE